MAVFWQQLPAILRIFAECVPTGGTPWATPDQEALDEVQDAEILKAVVTSMQEWQKKHSSNR
jgi:hypothetical protein